MLLRSLHNAAPSSNATEGNGFCNKMGVVHIQLFVIWAPYNHTICMAFEYTICMSFDHTARAGRQLLASLPPCETNYLLLSTSCLLVQHAEGEWVLSNQRRQVISLLWWPWPSGDSPISGSRVLCHQGGEPSALAEPVETWGAGLVTHSFTRGICENKRNTLLRKQIIKPHSKVLLD